MKTQKIRHISLAVAGLLAMKALAAYYPLSYYIPPSDQNNSKYCETPYLKTVGPTSMRYYPLEQGFNRHNVIPLSSIRYRPPQEPEPLPNEASQSPKSSHNYPHRSPATTRIPGTEDRDLNQAHEENKIKSEIDTSYSVESPDSQPEFITIEEIPPPPPRPLPDDFVIFLEQEKQKRELPEKDTVAVPFQLPYQEYPEQIQSSSKALYERK